MKKAIVIVISVALVLAVTAMVTSRSEGSGTSKMITLSPKNIQNAVYYPHLKQISIMLRDKIDGNEFLRIKDTEQAAAPDLLKMILNRPTRIQLEGDGDIIAYGFYVEND